MLLCCSLGPLRCPGTRNMVLTDPPPICGGPDGHAPTMVYFFYGFKVNTVIYRLENIRKTKNCLVRAYSTSKRSPAKYFGCCLYKNNCLFFNRF